MYSNEVQSKIDSKEAHWRLIYYLQTPNTLGLDTNQINTLICQFVYPYDCNICLLFCLMFCPHTFMNDTIFNFLRINTSNRYPGSYATPNTFFFQRAY